VTGVSEFMHSRRQDLTIDEVRRGNRERNAIYRARLHESRDNQIAAGQIMDEFVALRREVAE
jgi:hypothetical protein